MLRFLQADKITDVDSAGRILSKYRNREVELKLDFNTFKANLLDARASNGMLYVKFTWKPEGTDRGLAKAEHLYRYARSKVGQFVRFQASSDEFSGILSATTELPEGSSFDRYVDSPFVMAFAFNASDQKPLVYQRSASSKGSIIGVDVPKNVQDQLKLDSGLEFDPHVTVAYFPDLSVDDIPLILRCAQLAAEETGPISLFTDGSTTFPTPQDDGTYPLVAKVKSSGLHTFHDRVVSLLEHYSPGLVDTTFAHKNYTPHVTLKYVSKSNVSIPVKRLAWTVDNLYLSFRGGDEFFPIPLSESMRVGDNNSTYLQLGEVRVPINVLSKTKDEMHIQVLKGTHSELVEKLDGDPATLVTPTSENKMVVVQTQTEGLDKFRILYRPVISYMSADAKSKLRRVAIVSQERGCYDVAIRIGKLLDFSEDEDAEEDEDEDKEALGPGFPGTDPRIVQYVKAPQTQQIVEEPKFTRKMPLHERI